MSAVNLKKNLGLLVSFLRHEQDPWGIKDLESRFIYVNNFDYLNLPNNFNVEGLLDSELPHPVAELATEIQEHDRKVIQGQRLVPIIQTHFYHRKYQLQPYLFEKRPYYNEDNELVGTIYHGKKLNLFSLQRYFDKLAPSVLLLEPPNQLFTTKELEVIFFALQGLTSKEISRVLSLSHRTIENKLQAIYGKTNSNSLKQLKEYCLAKGFDCYIPPKFLRPEVKFIDS